jgi:glycosyltransferase involved in cell wall biosynthesis
MKICFVGLDNLPLLAPEYRQHPIGGESVQQTLLARALARRGHEVSMVVADYGQMDGAEWQKIRTFRAYRADAGLPVLRFIHPRWSGLWSALARANAELYYISCASMEVGLVALFCRRFRKRFVFRSASDTDCERSRLRLRFARDRWLYAYGLSRAHAILVQSDSQAQALARSYGLAGRVAGMLVEAPSSTVDRDIDALWVANVRRLKRPDRFLELADALPDLKMQMAGGPLRGEETLFHEVNRAAAARTNVHFHGRLSYWDANALYARAKVFVNTSEIEGFPNSYLQAWARGVPVVTLIDPDGVIEREGLGATVRSLAEMHGAIRRLLGDPAAWQAASERCRAFVAREHSEDRVVASYLDTFEKVMRAGAGSADMVVSRKAGHA